jgi:hypothetical protein
MDDYKKKRIMMDDPSKMAYTNALRSLAETGGSPTMPPQVADTKDVITDFLKKRGYKNREEIPPMESAMGGRGIDPYDLEKLKEEEEMRVAGRIFTPGQGWKPGPRST